MLSGYCNFCNHHFLDQFFFLEDIFILSLKEHRLSDEFAQQGVVGDFVFGFDVVKIRAEVEQAAGFGVFGYGGRYRF